MRKLLLALAVACHAPTPSPNPNPNPAPSSTPTPLATPTPTPTTVPTASATASTSAAPEAPKYLEDVDAWFRARGATTPDAVKLNPSCTEAKLGSHDALLCHGIPESLPTGESVYPLGVWYVASGKAVLTLATPIGAGPLDREIVPGEPARDDMYVELDATIEGSTLTIADRPAKPCAKVLAEYTSPELAGHRRVAQKACAARGKYVLQNGKLVRAP